MTGAQREDLLGQLREDRWTVLQRSLLRSREEVTGPSSDELIRADQDRLLEAVYLDAAKRGVGVVAVHGPTWTITEDHRWRPLTIECMRSLAESAGRIGNHGADFTCRVLALTVPLARLNWEGLR